MVTFVEIAGLGRALDITATHEGVPRASEVRALDEHVQIDGLMQLGLRILAP